MQEGLAVSDSALTVEDVSALFEKVFVKALKEVSVGEVFSDEWDIYRKVLEVDCYQRGHC